MTNSNLTRATLGIAVVAMSASAASISGSFAGGFKGFNEFGVPTTTFTLNLVCSLSCDPSAPELSFAVAGLASASFASEPTASTGYLGVGFATSLRMSGSATTENTSFRAGTRFIAEAKSVTCFCGNRTGEGGYVDLRTDVIVIPPWVTPPLNPKAGFETSVIVDAAPHGAETVEVVISGAGVSLTKALGPADFNVKGSSSRPAIVFFTPTSAGTVTVTATLNPGNATLTKTFEVVAGATSGAGGGSGGGVGAEPEPAAGCTAVPGLFPLAALVMVLLRRSRRC